ncbi:hypothetical protein YC2023_042346 [Brassica napus]
MRRLFMIKKNPLSQRVQVTGWSEGVGGDQSLQVKPRNQHIQVIPISLQGDSQTETIARIHNKRLIFNHNLSMDKERKRRQKSRIVTSKNHQKDKKLEKQKNIIDEISDHLNEMTEIVKKKLKKYSDLVEEENNNTPKTTSDTRKTSPILNQVKQTSKRSKFKYDQAWHFHKHIQREREDLILGKEK